MLMEFQTRDTLPDRGSIYLRNNTPLSPRQQRKKCTCLLLNNNQTSCTYFNGHVCFSKPTIPQT